MTSAPQDDAGPAIADSDHGRSLCAHPCPSCGMHHAIDRFEPHEVALHVRKQQFVYVIEWRAYDAPIWYRVQFADGQRANVDPCELAKLSDTLIETMWQERS